MLINILFSTLIWGVIGVAILKFLPVLGINPGNKINTITERCGEAVRAEEMLMIVLLAMMFRVVMYVIGLGSSILMQRPGNISWDFFFNAWNRWDAPRYISIAESGYDGMLEDGEPLNCAFFPLYPWLVRAFCVLIPNTKAACLVVSTFAYSAAMPFLYAMVAHDYGKKIAKLTCIYISIAPFSFFLGAMMSESVFLLTTVLSWYFIKKKRWILAAVAGFLAAMSRIAGVLIIIPYIMELAESNAQYFIEKRYRKWFISCIKQGTWVIIIPCGVIMYLLINYYYTGSCFSFMEYQQKFWLHTSCYFGKGISNMWNEFTSETRSLISKMDLFAPQMISYLFSAIIMLAGCRRHKSAYTLYFAAYFILNTGITWSMSGARYAALAIPLYIILAELTENKEYLKFGTVAIFAVLHGIYSTMYLAGHQIM